MSFYTLKVWAHWKRIELDNLDLRMDEKDKSDDKEWLADIEALIKFREDALEVIRFYGDEKNWEHSKQSWPTIFNDHINDAGQCARDFLKSIEEKK